MHQELSACRGALFCVRTMPRVALHTLGCKLNYAETATIGKQFLDRGFSLVDFGEPADVCVVNTCTVTERADRECRQVIRRAMRTSGNPVIVVTGCYAQLDPERIASIEGVDLVLGAREKFELFKYLGTMEKHATPKVFVSAIDTVDNFGPAFSTAAAGRTRAFLKVQDGCDYTCSFCTIPLARGMSRSQPIDECVRQARVLVDRGYKEIVLTGVNVGDYGKRSGDRLLTLLLRLAALEGLPRIRISSVEPNLLTDEVIDAVRSIPRLCAHFHVPLQSGHNEILRLMRRRYTTEDYGALIGRIRSAIPDCGIGVDVIVGFPGETDRHFDATYEFLNALPVSYLHVFTYSERPNTPAADFNGAVPPAVRQERNARLRILSQKKRHAFFETMIGRTLPVLCESDVEDGLRYGFTEHYVRVGIPADAAIENTILPVTIRTAGPDACLGSVTGGRDQA